MPKVKIEVRPVRAEDAPHTLRIVGGVFREYGMTYAPESWDKDLAAPHTYYKEPDAVFYVAEIDGKVLGMGGAHLESTHAELHRLYIDPKARGLGLGHALCDRVEAWVLKSGQPKMTLWSDVRFYHAHHLYRYRGYQIFGSRTIDDPDRSVEFGMARDLTQPRLRAENPFTTELAQSIRPISIAEAKQNPVLWHQALFTVAGIIDSRNLVGGGRITGDAHHLPELMEVFKNQKPTPDANVVLHVGSSNTVTRFERANPFELVTHPSCQD